MPHASAENRSTPFWTWGAHRPFILKKIRHGKRSRLKILLKTFNDPILLESWIKHHERIVGLENLIIADNWSTDEEVFSVYKKYHDTATIFHFGGFHNFLHDRDKFPELYKAIADSSDYLLAIDTDEFLIQLDEQSWSSGADIVRCLEKPVKTSSRGILTTYLYNYPYSDRIFSFGNGPEQLLRHTKWGKPIIPSGFCAPGQLIHNTQYPPDLFDDASFRGVFLLHLTQLSTVQRLSANRHKLIARKAIPETANLVDIAALNAADFKDSVTRRTIKEIRTLLAQPFEPVSLAKNHLRLGDEGQVRFLPGDREQFFVACDQAKTGFLASLQR